jgi:hypothetical protein
MDKTTKNIIMIGVQADIRSKHLPNASLERYHYTSPVGIKSMKPISREGNSYSASTEIPY